MTPPTPVRRVTDEERRQRLVIRHALTPASKVADVEHAARAVVALHATEPASVYLSCWARVADLDVGDVDDALYEQRSIVKQLAMRRTLFAFPRDLLAPAWAGPAARVERNERRLLIRDVEAAELNADGEAWLSGVRDDVLAVLAANPDGLLAAEVRAAVPTLEVPRLGDPYAGSVVSRVLRRLGLTGDIVRGPNHGHWRTSRPGWMLSGDWLAEAPPPTDEATGYRELVERWLERFGPGTEADICWWLGATKATVREALRSLGAVPVDLDHGATGWLLPHDLDAPPQTEPSAALLPILDPTTMGWQEREFFLGPHREDLFDRNGNAGTTAWFAARVIGCWTQDEHARVAVHPLEPLTADARRALDAEANRLTDWLDGERIASSITSPAMARARETARS